MSRSATSPDASRTAIRPRPSSTRYDDDLEYQDGGRHAVAQRGDARRLGVEHVVERLDVQAGRARRRHRVEGLRREPPEPALDLLLGSLGRISRVAPGHDVRQPQGAAVELDQQGERAAALRLGQGLRAQVRRPDRVGGGDDVRAAILVSGDGQ